MAGKDTCDEILPLFPPKSPPSPKEKRLSCTVRNLGGLKSVSCLRARRRPLHLAHMYRLSPSRNSSWQKRRIAASREVTARRPGEVSSSDRSRKGSCVLDSVEQVRQRIWDWSLPLSHACNTVYRPCVPGGFELAARGKNSFVSRSRAQRINSCA